MSYKYFTRCRKDPFWLKLIVAVTLLVDAVSTIDHYVMIYMYTITHWGNEVFLKRQYWPMPVYLVTTGASAWIVQHFLIFRYWLLSRNKFITPFLILSSMIAFAGAIVTAVVIVKFPEYENRAKADIPVTTWLVASAVSDILIAAILIYTLQRLRTALRKTENLVKRLTILAIQTGSPGSLVATIGLIVYLNDNENNISVGIAFSLGRIYALTMLHNLNSRAQIRHSSSNVTGMETTMHLSLGDTFLLNTDASPGETSTEKSGAHYGSSATESSNFSANGDKSNLDSISSAV
ncbi:hypothetical protein PQX77_004905 [Marasmius sp. AFHP31]|nr:hypothetical protein PQX77_004905 [Marasmius sp. AFHP31]